MPNIRHTVLPAIFAKKVFASLSPKKISLCHPSPPITSPSSRTMRSAAAPILLIALIIALLAPSSSSFSSQATRQHRLKSLVVVMSATEQSQQQHHQPRHPHCDLPGDPSLFLTTNVNLGENKGAIMKELSSLVATVTRKPEAYVGE